MLWPVFVLVAFAAGSIPFGLLIARTQGIDIRQHGSGNIGATNVWRVLGPRFGLPCFVLDVVKGTAPVLAAGLAHGHVAASAAVQRLPASEAWWWLAVVAAAILGHMFTPWASFKGGKGVATGLGATLGVWPILTVPAAAGFLVWVAVMRATRMVSVGSCVAAAALPALVLAWATLSAGLEAWRDVAPFVVLTAGMGLLVIYRHRANLRRVWAGTENRVRWAGSGMGRPAGPDKRGV